ncbi:hypothetical protein C4D60_Mb04t11710 [Musa balbisiana]|uniref:GH16 domain-containing protein n=1 Tax=Musa balbisiana TaxID=52838 RepID=A0A4S8KBB6_MUSBA|nr:hypothetical protein C4D60_Mb04t11710 [Musa balbisiana]
MDTTLCGGPSIKQSQQTSPRWPSGSTGAQVCCSSSSSLTVHLSLMLTNPTSVASMTGSGFKSNRPFRSGYFAASIKLQPGDTAGVITAFYVSCFLGQLPLPSCLLACASFDIVLQLSNNQVHPGFHDEVDIEFLGTTPGRPYKLQTNVYVKGSGDGRLIGREMKFHLWFDPAADFHHYAILWNPNEMM